MRLSSREREVIAAMRASERAAGAIHGYAIKFAGDQQAVTPSTMSRDYEEQYE